MADQVTASVEQQRILKVPSGLKSLIEGLIFAAEEPLTVREIKAIYEQPAGDEVRHIDQPEIQAMIETLNEEYKRANRPYRIIMIAGGYQFATLKEYAEWLGRLFHEQSRRKLSQSSLETLAIVAYKQPVSKPEIEAIRGVNCDYVLKTLLEKELLTIVGRAETVGRPLLYGTTREFLKHFGLREVTDLPRPREIEEILGESQFETERRMLEAQAGADQVKKEEEDFKSRLPHIPRKKSELDEDVHIIPKTKARRLSLRTKEEKQDSASTTTLPEPARPIAAGESAESSKGPGAMIPDMPQAATQETAVEGTAEIVPEISTVSSEVDHSPRDKRKITMEELSSILTLPPIEPEKTQPRRSPWTSWKTKIQTFIRKLFG